MLDKPGSFQMLFFIQGEKMEEKELKFGYISYEQSIPVVSAFGKNLLAGKLTASACKKCNAVYLPPRTGCNKCFCNEMEEKEIPPEAELTSFTVIHFAPESFSDKAPYIAALGKFSGGHSLLAHLVGVTEMPEIGLKMKLVPQRLGENRVAYKFVKL